MSKESRREIYRAYRDMGFSPAEASARRGRNTQVFNDVRSHNEDVREFAGEIPEANYVRYPRFELSRTQRDQAEDQFSAFGLPDSLAANLADKKSGDVVSTLNQFAGFDEALNELPGYQEFIDQVGDIETEEEFWDLYRAFYETVKGVK